MRKQANLIHRQQSYNSSKKYDQATISSILNIQRRNIEDFGLVKKCFRREMIKAQTNSERRIALSQAYLYAIHHIFGGKPNQIVLMINNKDIRGLEKIFEKNKHLLDKLISDYPPIYYAVRAGHYSIVEYLLKKGCSIFFKGQKSTPMHAASFFGQRSLIPLLLEYGIPTDIKNAFDHEPIEQAATEQIIEMLKNAHLNKINVLQQNLLGIKILLTTINVKDPKRDQIAFKKILLSRCKYDYPQESFVDAFHGTSYKALESIAINGLRKSGDLVDGKEVKTVVGHIQMGTSLAGIKDWPRAIFLSPSIYYAAHPVYAKELITNKQETWLPVVQVKAEVNSFTKHNHTLVFYKHKDNEPNDVEYRVEEDLPDNQEDKMIYRNQDSAKVHVVAIILIRKGFLDSSSNYKQTTKLMLNSPEEQKVRAQQGA